MNVNFVFTPKHVFYTAMGIIVTGGLAFIIKKAVEIKKNTTELINDSIVIANQFANEVSNIIETGQEAVGNTAANAIIMATTPTSISNVSSILGKDLTNKYLNYLINSNYDYVASSNSYVKTNETFEEKMRRLVYEHPEQVSEYYAKVLGLEKDWRQSLKSHNIDLSNYHLDLGDE